MTTLTPAQIATVAAGAGFRGTALRNAVAVALAESGGRTDAVGVNSDRWRSRDRGLWQINDHWHPEVSDALAFNPVTCARAAYRISAGGTNWSPWSTWKNGAAQTQMAKAQIGVNQAAGGGGVVGADFITPGPIPDIPLPGDDFGFGDVGGAIGDVVTTPLEAAKTMITLAIKTGAWLSDPHNWQRVALVSGGSVAVLIALGMIGRSGAAGDTAKAIADAPAKLIGQAGAVGKTAVSLVGTKGVGSAGKAAGTASKAAGAAGVAASVK